MKEVLEYIIFLINNPGDFDINRQVHEDRIFNLVNNYADTRPPTIQQMAEQLSAVYPSVRNKVELIEKGNQLRDEIIEKIFDPGCATDDVKKYEARIALFEKLLVFDKTINNIIKNMEGAPDDNKAKKKIKFEVDGQVGSAQKLLSKNG